jgi:putative CocE/NonD family hydrolase
MSESNERREDKADVQIQLGIKIPLRDGIHLNATLYLPWPRAEPSPVIFTLTPYIGHVYHQSGLYFARRGLPFLTIDARGRGNSEGEFRPFIHDAMDGYDVVEWLAQQPYCNGKVAMFGGSYGGYAQWATAKELPPHLATIVPVASPYIGVDFPMRNNISGPYLMQWLTLIFGHTSQAWIFADKEYWNAKFRNWLESGASFKELDSQLGNPSAVFQEWISHPQLDSYWDSHNPTTEEYSNLSIPVLTITGSYDDDQPGALMHYREHLANAAPDVRAGHYLVIGPWDHAGTYAPKLEFGGIKVGSGSLLDIHKLHLQWYVWILQCGPRPEFLQKNIAYYVVGADQWRYAKTLDEITPQSLALFLSCSTAPTDVFNSGSLGPDVPMDVASSNYVYDPRNLSGAVLESTMDPESLCDQRLIYHLVGRQLIYHSAPFEKNTEISGFFKLVAWLSIDRPDTDFAVSVYEIGDDGESVLLSTDRMRARYRESLREEALIRTTEPLRYDFERFLFVSREIKRGRRLRLIIGPINSIHSQKNYNAGGVVAEESIENARPVNVRLFHDRDHPSALYVPIGRPYSSYEPAAPAIALLSSSRAPAGGATHA